MIVYAESNFVLELAFEQEEFAVCRNLADRARQGLVKLAIPAIAFTEPYEKLFRNRSARNRLSQELQNSLRDLKRSAQFATSADELLVKATALFTESNAAQERHLDDVLDHLCGISTILPSTQSAIVASRKVRVRTNCSAEDSLVATCVLEHASAMEGAKILVSRDEAFSDDEIATELTACGVKHVFRFADALGILDAPN